MQATMATRKISRRMKEKAQSKKGAPKMHARAPGNKSKLHVHPSIHPSIRRSCHPSFHPFIHEYVRSCMHHLRHSCIYKKHDLCRKKGADLKRMFARAAGAGNRGREGRAARSGAAGPRGRVHAPHSHTALFTPTPRCLPPPPSLPPHPYHTSPLPGLPSTWSNDRAGAPCESEPQASCKRRDVQRRRPHAISCFLA